jgi:HK97 gp10 family phage protein
MQVFFKTDFTKALNFLDAIPKRVGRALDKWKVQSASEVLREGQREAPYRSGRLRDSIAVSFSSSAAQVGTSLYYAKYQEFGTRYIKPRRFLRGALDARRDYILKLAEELIGKELSS